MLLSQEEQDGIRAKLTSLFDGMMKSLYRQKGANFNIEILAGEKAQEFITAHADVLDSAFQQVEMSDAMRRRLQRSNYIFSGMKAFHEMNEAFPSLLDENGNRKPFKQFLDDVRKIDQTYNEHYLRAEYNFVQASAEMAAKWEQFAQDGDRYYLQYRTVGDSKVRPEHAAMHGITLPMSDPFWEDFYPPNGWNCFIGSTPILTNSGWRYIQNLKAGDLVVGGSGEYRAIIAVNSREINDELVSIFTKGHATTCTKNHRFLTPFGWKEAGLLCSSDIIIQVSKVSPLDILINAIHNSIALFKYFFIFPIRERKSISTLAVNSNIHSRYKEVYNISPEQLSLFEWDSHIHKIAAHEGFACTFRESDCAHVFWMFFPCLKRIFQSLSLYFWAKKRTVGFKFFSNTTYKRAILGVFSLPNMFASYCKSVISRCKNFASLCSTSSVVDPLSSNSFTTVSDRNIAITKDIVNSFVGDTPMRHQPSKTSLFDKISPFCGIGNPAAFDSFNSIYDFLTKTFFHTRYHLIDGKVTTKKQKVTVYNFEVEQDESYITPLGIAHNCRCSVAQVRKSKHPATDSAEAIALGEIATGRDTKGIFHFNAGKEQKTFPDYNPYTIRKCKDCDIAKGKAKLARFVSENELCESCGLIRSCWARREDNVQETFSECETSNGKLRVSSKHGKNEKKENVRVGRYLAEKHGYEIDLIANLQNETSADSFNKTLGIEQEYKVNATPTKSAIDNLVRDGSKQAKDLVLFVDSGISLDELSSALHNRVRRTNLKTVMVVINGMDRTYSYEEIVANGFKVRQADLT